VTTPLTEQAAEYAAEVAAPGSLADRAVQRAFMAGALAVATSKEPREALRAECVQFGKTIGTAAEVAR
jgi:hypothetical protein